MKPTLTSASAVVLAALLLLPASAAEIVFLSGKTLECKVLSKDAKALKVEITANGKPAAVTYQLSSIHAVTINGKRYVINEKSLAQSRSAQGESNAGSASNDSDHDDTATRSRAEVEALIDREGRQPPEWFESTPLDYPATLDLSWPEHPPKGWNNQSNVGQYIWDIINPNENKWRSGVRLMHHLLTMHKDDPEKRTRIMHTLGNMYHNLHQDYARAAFWYRQAGVGKGSKFDKQGAGAHLAECYWRLGNKQMAVELLKKLPNTYATLKLWGDMGETAKAVQLANAALGTRPRWPAELHLLIGDAYRVAGDQNRALQAYENAAESASEPDHAREEKLRARAQASADAIKLARGVDLQQIPDGKYRAESLGYEGPVRVEVAVQSGRIEDVRVVQHKEKQFYSALVDTPAKIILKQGVKGVDATSSATITSEAIINAAARALSSGAK